MDLSLNMKAVVAQRLIPTIDGKARRAAVEVMINTPLMADMILKGEVHSMKELIKKSGEYGMCTFDRALYILFRDGLISQDEAVRNADSANEVRLMIKMGRDDGESLGSSLSGLTLEEVDNGRNMMR
jgi:twitching motility protein PilU